MDLPPKQLWFRRKTYGYGWTPANKNGWLATLIFLILFIGPISLYSNYIKQEVFPWKIVLYWFVLTAAFLVLCYKTGETPKWQWGDNSNNNKK